MLKELRGRKLWVALSGAALLLPASLLGGQAKANKQAKATSAPAENTLQHQVRHQIQVLPYYSVFDYITFTLDGSKVTLSGQVLRPTLRNHAEGAIKSIEGVSSVTNLIEVLPKSPADDQARRAVYRAIFEDPVLQRYATSEVPLIHIVVKDGAITLEGVVDRESDKSLAGSRAAGVSGIAAVKNSLAIHIKQSAAN
jgi:hyperosmotically inducible protein